MTDAAAGLVLNDFPSRTREKLRYGDTDRQGHINNAVFATLFESGRVSFLYDPARPLYPDGAQFVIAKLTITFAGELNWPGEVEIGTGVSRLGRSSFTLVQGLFKDGQAVASAESVMVLMDETTRRSTPLPTATQDALSQLMLVT